MGKPYINEKLKKRFPYHATLGLPLDPDFFINLVATCEKNFKKNFDLSLHSRKDKRTKAFFDDNITLFIATFYFKEEKSLSWFIMTYGHAVIK